MAMSILLFIADIGAGSVLLLVAFTVGLLYKRFNRKITPTPPLPGPKGLPIIGNLLDLPKDKEWETFTDWGRQYGELLEVPMLFTC